MCVYRNQATQIRFDSSRFFFFFRIPPHPSTNSKWVWQPVCPLEVKFSIGHNTHVKGRERKLAHEERERAKGTRHSVRVWVHNVGHHDFWRSHRHHATMGSVKPVLPVDVTPSVVYLRPFVVLIRYIRSTSEVKLFRVSASRFFFENFSVRYSLSSPSITSIFLFLSGMAS